MKKMKTYYLNTKGIFQRVFVITGILAVIVIALAFTAEDKVENSIAPAAMAVEVATPVFENCLIQTILLFKTTC